MINNENKPVDLYIPRKCTATNNLITAKDHASVQLNIGNIDENGVYTGTYKTVAFCGKVRNDGEADDAMNRFCIENKIMRDVQ